MFQIILLVLFRLTFDQILISQNIRLDIIKILTQRLENVFLANQ